MKIPTRTKPLRNTDQAGVYCDLSPSTLEGYRVTGDGPTFLKLGRKVLYDEDDLDDWLASRKHKSTSEYGAGDRASSSIRVLVELDDDWAVGDDGEQRMLLRAGHSSGESEWNPVGFTASDKDLLLLTMLKHGVVPTPEARAKLDALPHQFSDWKAAQP